VGKERRRTPRYEIGRDYYFIPGASGKRHPCRVNNISVTGACISSGTVLKRSDVILLHIAGIRETAFKSEVMWAREGMYGVLFHLDTPEDLANISFVMNNIAGAINSPRP